MRHQARENFERVIHWDQPSHVCDLGAEPISRGISYHGAWPRHLRPNADCCKWQDIWGVGWVDADGEIFPVTPAIPSIDRLEDLQLPDVAALGIRKHLKEAVAAIDRSRYNLSVNHPYLLYEKAFNLLGPEEFLSSLATEPEAAEALLDKILAWELRVAEEYVQLRPEHIQTYDDYGMQDRLAVSPEMWRRYFKPRLGKLLAFYRDALGPNIVIGHHSCGHVLPIIEDFIELGVTILDPNGTKLRYKML